MALILAIFLFTVFGTSVPKSVHHLGSNVFVEDSSGRMRILKPHEVHRAGEAYIGLPGVKSLHDMPNLKHGEGMEIPTMHELKAKGYEISPGPRVAHNYDRKQLHFIDEPRNSHGYRENAVQVIHMPRASVSYKGNSNVNIVRIPSNYQSNNERYGSKSMQHIFKGQAYDQFKVDRKYGRGGKYGSGGNELSGDINMVMKSDSNYGGNKYNFKHYDRNPSYQKYDQSNYDKKPSNKKYGQSNYDNKPSNKKYGQSNYDKKHSNQKYGQSNYDKKHSNQNYGPEFMFRMPEGRQSVSSGPGNVGPIQDHGPVDVGMMHGPGPEILPPPIDSVTSSGFDPSLNAQPQFDPNFGGTAEAFNANWGAGPGNFAAGGQNQINPGWDNNLGSNGLNGGFPGWGQQDWSAQAAQGWGQGFNQAAWAQQAMATQQATAAQQAMAAQQAIATQQAMATQQGFNQAAANSNFQAGAPLQNFANLNSPENFQSRFVFQHQAPTVKNTVDNIKPILPGDAKAASG